MAICIAGAIKNNTPRYSLAGRIKMLNNISVRTFITLFLVCTVVVLNIVEVILSAGFNVIIGTDVVCTISLLYLW
ncbi:methyl-accepting chemotaxis protein, partial [Citrobacter youngae]